MIRTLENIFLADSLTSVKARQALKARVEAWLESEDGIVWLRIWDKEEPEMFYNIEYLDELF